MVAATESIERFQDHLSQYACANEVANVMKRYEDVNDTASSISAAKFKLLETELTKSQSKRKNIAAALQVHLQDNDFDTARSYPNTFIWTPNGIEWRQESTCAQQKHRTAIASTQRIETKQCHQRTKEPEYSIQSNGETNNSGVAALQDRNRTLLSDLHVISADTTSRQMLTSEIKLLSQQLDDANERRLCVVCLEEPRSAVLTCSYKQRQNGNKSIPFTPVKLKCYFIEKYIIQ